MTNPLSDNQRAEIRAELDALIRKAVSERAYIAPEAQDRWVTEQLFGISNWTANRIFQALDEREFDRAVEDMGEDA